MHSLSDWLDRRAFSFSTWKKIFSLFFFSLDFLLHFFVKKKEENKMYELQSNMKRIHFRLILTCENLKCTHNYFLILRKNLCTWNNKCYTFAVFMKILFSYLKRYKKYVLFSFLLAAINQSFSLLDPVFMGKLFDYVRLNAVDKHFTYPEYFGCVFVRNVFVFILFHFSFSYNSTW